jgi:hypothetical protein
MDRGRYLVVQTRPDVCALYPIPVRHPVRSRYPDFQAASSRSIVATTSLPTATPFASIWLGLRLAK